MTNLAERGQFKFGDDDLRLGHFFGLVVSSLSPRSVVQHISSEFQSMCYPYTDGIIFLSW